MLQHRIRGFAAAMLATGLLLPVAGAAQPADAEADAPAPDQQTQAQKLVQKYRETSQQLRRIRDEAVATNPELEEQSRTYQERIEQAMSDGGYDVDAGQEKLRKMGERYKNEDLSQEERQKLAGEFKAEREKMQQARQQAKQKEEIRVSGQALQESIIVAMKEQDPQTEELLQRLRKLRQKLQAMQSSGDGPAASQGG